LRDPFDCRFPRTRARPCANTRKSRSNREDGDAADTEPRSAGACAEGIRLQSNPSNGPATGAPARTTLML
ncbi:hypothetical protein DN511_31330, partial [Burkholderia multivorans]